MDTILIDIIDNFAHEGIVFINEQQFQFELALALRKYPGIKVELEALTIDNDWDEVRQQVITGNKKLSLDRTYIDLIVEKEGLFYAIELKMKTPNNIHFYKTSKGEFITMKQGAENVNTYRFFEDIVRLENINTRYFGSGIVITKSYAILLTNSAVYRENDGSSRDIWRNYVINEGRVIKGTLFFREKQDKHKIGNKTIENIVFKNQYGPLKWHNYELKNNKDEYNHTSNSPKFQYLIVPVTPIL